MTDEAFWNNREKAQGFIDEAGGIRNKLEPLHRFEKQLDDFRVLVELGQAEPPASQAAIERLGARKDGVIRGHALRRDGTIRDTVMYSLRSGEWPEVKAQLLYSLHKPR